MAQYLRLVPFVGKYIGRIMNTDQTGGRAREDQVDHLWNNIFVYYFQRLRPEVFTVERESYLSPTQQRRANIAVVNLRNNRMHKCILFEAKRPSGQGPEPNPTAAEWAAAELELEQNLNLAKLTDGSVQGMYGVVAIGMWCRMFYVTTNANVLGPTQGLGAGRTLNLITDSKTIEEELKDWATNIHARTNV
ncbi:hypothetical protein BJY01DRAFT_246713 [Aspergillus pseudoustus]|uniref:Uncharacterized protein n=1 Tax=Aspergillus pseudoustus TaxID=1810923 RepID=A0ABR4K6R3_9EURO